nr:flagellar hook-associated protein FlgK [uncultured Fretibacterium sp.]
MLNSFYGLEMGKRALNAFRLGLQTVGHNVSNMKTAGYSRQRVNLSTMPPYATPGESRAGGPGQVGMGVKVDEIVRIRDEFLDFQYRSSLSTLGYWDKINKLYEAIQNYIPEPVKPGIRVSMDNFFNAMQKLQENPESTAARQALVESARSLGGTLSGVIKGVESYSKALNDEVKTSVDQANRILHEIASLNKQIYQLKALGQNPNDLLDQRDLLLDKISRMMDVTFQEPLKVGDTTGEFFMTLNGRTLIQGDHVRELRAHAFQWDGKVYYDVQVAENEFDIVENCKVADVLATGPEGVHQLNVDRLANGKEWEIGGGDPLCLNPDGTVKEPRVSMRRRPMTTTEALGIKGSFRIQVGTQGTRVASKIFSNANDPDLDPGDILGPGKAGDSYTFRVGAHDAQVDVTVKWDDTAKKWKMTSDVFATTAGGTSNVPLPATYPAEGTGDRLTVGDVADFLKAALPKSGQNAFTVHSGPAGAPTQLAVESKENWLVSITDVEGDLAARMGMKNPSPTVTIDVEEGDSLEIIRNKINEKYQAEFGVKAPEQWVHASLKQDSDQSWYLTFASDVPGEAQRITLLGGEDGNLQTLRRLGLLKLEQTGKTAANAPVYREVSAFSTVAEDASFTFDGARYLSADNKFDKARRVPALGNDSDYSARTLSTVSEGMRFKLKGVGSTAITVRHHVRGGSIKALEEARDGVIPELEATLDGLAWELVKHINAYQYSGYGIGGNQETTGVAFFKPLRFKSDAASGLDVNEAVRSANGLIGAAMGKLDASGKATFGKSGGSGNGKNAARMLGLKSARVLENGSTTVGGYYDAFLAKIGSDAGHAELMFKAQQHIASQLDVQRQSVMGVNMDEELLDMMALNKAFGAMARYATTVDEMLDRIINGFGLVGR